MKKSFLLILALLSFTKLFSNLICKIEVDNIYPIPECSIIKGKVVIENNSYKNINVIYHLNAPSEIQFSKATKQNEALSIRNYQTSEIPFEFIVSKSLFDSLLNINAEIIDIDNHSTISKSVEILPINIKKVEKGLEFPYNLTVCNQSLIISTSNDFEQNVKLYDNKNLKIISHDKRNTGILSNFKSKQVYGCENGIMTSFISKDLANKMGKHSSLDFNNEWIDSEKTEILLYPNPTSEIINIKVLKDEKGYDTIELFNNQGELLNRIQNSNNTLVVSELPDGIYYLRVKINQTKFISKSFVKITNN